MSTLPNFDALARISAAHHFLSTHMDLPPFDTFTYTRGTIVLYVKDSATVDTYAKALGLPPGEATDPYKGTWTFAAVNGLWNVYTSMGEPVPQLGAETSENTLAGAVS